MSQILDLVGQRFGRLVVTSRAGSSARGKACWQCLCDCGREVVRQGPSLRSGRTGSCGCRKGVDTTDPATLRRRAQERDRYWMKKRQREMVRALASQKW